ncbi:MAG: ABC transporter permease subunit [Deltaproteobacteria bacterium]|nr:ABC transporter permease subunit [Deltaproteobacteria bacterium]
MSNTSTIAGRQFRSYFNGAAAYIVISIVMLALGILFWKTFFLYGKSTTREMFRWLSLILVFAAPAISMGLLAEEKRTGTIELLITMPVKDSEVILGKYIGVMGLYVVLLLLTLPYPFSVSSLGHLDWGTVISGYVGLFLWGGAMLAIGLMASSFTDNQLVAFFIGLAINFSLWLIGPMLQLLPAEFASIFQWLSFDFHFERMQRGVIAVRDVIYFLSIVAIGLSVAFRSLESRRWS